MKNTIIKLGFVTGVLLSGCGTEDDSSIPTPDTLDLKIENKKDYLGKEGFNQIVSEYEKLKEWEKETQRLLKLEEYHKEKERLAEIERQKELKKKQELAKSESVDTSGGNWVNAQLTHYIAHCSEGCGGVTASGYNVSNTIYYKGYRIVASSKSIPLYSIVRIEYPNGTTFDAVVLDRGGAISHTGILDVLVSSTKEARSLGRQKGKYKIIGSLK